MSNYNEAYDMAMDMLEGSDDTLGIYSALKEAGSRCGIDYGPDMQAFVRWSEKKMGIDK